ncbi:MAG: hypothetical protein SGJ13_10515 [Actinomycetota bacterium]|nr:hypothetical protein [Actinomycetota bacterium]
MQPIGSKGLSGVSVAAADPQAGQRPTSARPAGNQPPNHPPHTVTAEPVVFPREGLPVDQRPLQMRTMKAATRYREMQEMEPRPEPKAHSRRARR